MHKQLRRKHVQELMGWSSMTLDRYTKDPTYARHNFPKPRYIGRTPIWDERELMAWVESLPKSA